MAASRTVHSSRFTFRILDNYRFTLTYFSQFSLLIHRLQWTMFRFCLFWIFAVFIVCSFCGKDFKSLGHHSWRFKKRRSNSSATDEQPIPTLQDESNQVCIRIVVKFSCGKECKGVKGLKVHQRRCRVIEDMDE